MNGQIIADLQILEVNKKEKVAQKSGKLPVSRTTTT